MIRHSESTSHLRERLRHVCTSIWKSRLFSSMLCLFTDKHAIDYTLTCATCGYKGIPMNHAVSLAIRYHINTDCWRLPGNLLKHLCRCLFNCVPICEGANQTRCWYVSFGSPSWILSSGRLLSRQCKVINVSPSAIGVGYGWIMLYVLSSRRISPSILEDRLVCLIQIYTQRNSPNAGTMQLDGFLSSHGNPRYTFLFLFHGYTLHCVYKCSWSGPYLVILQKNAGAFPL